MNTLTCYNGNNDSELRMAREGHSEHPLGPGVLVCVTHNLGGLTGTTPGWEWPKQGTAIA